MKPYQPIVAEILNKTCPTNVLDAPSGAGWLKEMLTYEVTLDGLDLFSTKPEGYNFFQSENLDNGLPAYLGKYEAIVCCEGIEHLSNPGLFFKTANEHLVSGGQIIVTTPNTWNPFARIKYFLKGFFPGFPCLIGKIEYGSHMHIMPWSYPSLYLFLRLNGFSKITLHKVNEPKHIYERIFGILNRPGI